MGEPEVEAALALDSRVLQEGLEPWVARAQEAGQVRTDRSAHDLTAWLMVVIDGFLGGSRWTRTSRPTPSGPRSSTSYDDCSRPRRSPSCDTRRARPTPTCPVRRGPGCSSPPTAQPGQVLGVLGAVAVLAGRALFCSSTRESRRTGAGVPASAAATERATSTPKRAVSVACHMKWRIAFVRPGRRGRVAASSCGGLRDAQHLKRPRVRGRPGRGGDRTAVPQVPAWMACCTTSPKPMDTQCQTRGMSRPLRFPAQLRPGDRLRRDCSVRRRHGRLGGADRVLPGLAARRGYDVVVGGASTVTASPPPPRSSARPS